MRQFFKTIFLVFLVLLTSVSCSFLNKTKVGKLDQAFQKNSEIEVSKNVVLPVAEYESRRTFKAFGEYISDRFTGYHAGDDIEYADTITDVPVRAIADGKIIKHGRVSGYGGMILIAHNISGKTVNAIYGHLDLDSVALRVGQEVTKGQVIANLGSDKSAATDGERKHLHFALYEGSPTRINGYVSTSTGLGDWINPQQFFLGQGLELDSSQRQFNPEKDLGGSDFKVSFIIPENMEVEYVPQIKALNIFSLNGQGDARSRSQVFIRFFDANDFLTLNTVNIFKTESLFVGQDRYSAKRYDIEKKSSVVNFAYQPEWRSGRHYVTDIRSNEGYSRFFVVAKNPSLDEDTFQNILDSFK